MALRGMSIFLHDWESTAKATYAKTSAIHESVSDVLADRSAVLGRDAESEKQGGGEEQDVHLDRGSSDRRSASRLRIFECKSVVL